MKVVVFVLGAAALSLALAACDAGPSATSKAPAPRGASSSGVASAPAGASSPQQASADPRDQPVPLVEGKPMWAANRKHTAQENADYQFGKNGKDFGAANEADYVARAHHFVDAPPAGVEKVQRANGDFLLYDARSNTFAVVTKAGAPRTMFKPRDGVAYWRQQVSRERSNGDDSSQS
jgi:pyocin large subunit-like protein